MESTFNSDERLEQKDLNIVFIEVCVRRLALKNGEQLILSMILKIYFIIRYFTND